TPAQAADVLGRVAAGQCKLALAHGEPDARYALEFVHTTARRDGDGFLLNGVKQTVIDGAVADLILVSAWRADAKALSLFLVAPDANGLEVTRYRTQDGRSGADLALRDVRVTKEALLGDERDAFADLERALEHGIAALCAEAVGCMEAVNAA